MSSIKLPQILILVLCLITQTAISIENVKFVINKQTYSSYQLEIVTKKKIAHNIFVLTKPHRLVIDLTAVAKINLPKFTDDLIIYLRQGKHKNNTVRVVLDLADEISWKKKYLYDSKAQQSKLIINFAAKNLSKQNIINLFELSDYVTRQKFKVVIDAGHGGSDPGAIGPSGIKEKDLTLAIAKKLVKRMHTDNLMQPILLRKGDYNLSLIQRRKQAKLARADLLVSIHADAFYQHNAQGSSVFIYSYDNPSSAATRWLAAATNLADMRNNLSLQKQDYALEKVFFDLKRTETLHASRNAAQFVLQEIKKNMPLHRREIERGDFLILKYPDIPAILIEAGFISNPEYEKKMLTADFQNKLVESIYSGIKKYSRNI